jgi:hypothetical protein
MILKIIIITDNQFVVPKIYIYIFKLYLNLRNPKIIFFIAQLSLLFSLVQEIMQQQKLAQPGQRKFQIKPTLSLLPKFVIATTSASNSTTTSVATKIHLQNTEAHCPTLLYHRKSP